MPQEFVPQGQFAPHHLYMRDSRTLPVAKEIASRSANTDEYIENVFDYIQKHVTYAEDKPRFGYAEYVQTPMETLQMGLADCLPYDQNIPIIEDGRYNLVPIGELVEKNDGKERHVISLHMETKEIELRKILSYQKKGRKRLRKVKLKNGRTVRATGNHKFFTLSGDADGIQIIEKTVNELEPGDFLLGLNNIPSLDIDPSVDPSLLWVDGMYLAEGWTHKSHTSISNDNMGVIYRLMDILDCNGISHRKSKRIIHQYIDIHKGPYKERLKEMGSDSFDMHVLPEHYSMSKPDIAELIDGHRVGDGYKNPKRGPSSRVKCIYGTSSDRLAEDLNFLRLILGNPFHIEYVLNHGGVGNKPIWRLYDLDNSRFKTNIPYEPVFEYVKKQSELRIKNKSALYKKYGIQWPVTDLRKTITKSQVEKTINVLGLGGYNWLYSDDLNWFEVVSIEDDKIEETYDIGVEGNHNFMLANGILAHNCEDMGILFVNLMEHMGIPARMALGYGGIGSHRWAETIWKGQMYVMDPTVSKERGIFPTDMMSQMQYKPLFLITPFSFAMAEFPFIPPMPLP